MSFLIRLQFLVVLAAAATTFPYTIDTQWNTGFAVHEGKLCISAGSSGTCGWRVEIVFNQAVDSIIAYNFEQEPNQSATATYYGTDKYASTATLAANAEYCISMNGNLNNVNEDVSVVSASFVDKSRTGTCGGNNQQTTQSQTTQQETTPQTTQQETTPQTTQQETTPQTTQSQTTQQETTPQTSEAETTTASGITQSTGVIDNDYTEVLEKSILFYEAQRSGALPADNRVAWRGNSALDDGADEGVNLEGGWYDAGDHVKFNLPMAWSTTVLAWGIIQFREGYVAAQQLDNALDSIKWPLDYLLKCWRQNVPEYWAQVGDGYADHSVWQRPENMTMDRPAFRVNTTHPGSDVAGEAAAAFAAGYLAFKDTKPNYAGRLLDNARSLFSFAETYQGNYITDGKIPAGDFYNSWSGYQDELCWAAVWLYKATGESDYLTKANSFVSPNSVGEFSWDNKVVGCQVLLYEEQRSNAGLAALVEEFLATWRNDKTETPLCGLAWNSLWGPLRYSANTALIGLVAADLGVNTDINREWALSQVEYMLGANEADRSYVVGFGNNPPVKPHHRSSSCDADHSVACSWDAFNSPDPNPSDLNGALVGGPAADGSFKDDRSDFYENEVACDYNAGFQSAVAGLIKLQNDGNFPTDHNSCCRSDMPFCQV